MVVEAVDRILWKVKKRTPLNLTPYVLEEEGSGCFSTVDTKPILSVKALDDDTARVIYDWDEAVSTRVVRGDQINKENLYKARHLPAIRFFLGISTKIEWRPSQRRSR